MRVVVGLLLTVLATGVAADPSSDPFPPIQVGQSIEEIQRLHPEAYWHGTLFIGDLTSPRVTMAWPSRDRKSVMAFESAMRGVKGPRESRLAALTSKFCQDQEQRPSKKYEFMTICGQGCPEKTCVFLVDTGCAFAEGVEDETKSYPDRMCTWVQADEAGDAVAMANPHRMYSDVYDPGTNSR